MSDGYFAQIETSFILNDARLDEMTNSQRFCYIVLWCYAVDQHKETLKFPNLARTLSRVCRNDTRSIRSALAKFRELCLIEMPDENTITVCGVRNKHPKLKWQDSKVERRVKGAQGNRLDKSRVDKIRVDKKPSAKADPNHSKFVKYYVDKYKETFQTKYIFNGGKDAKAVKTLLATYGFDELCSMVPVFFADDSAFVKGHDLPKFLYQAQGIREEMNKPKKEETW